ncbi:MAG: hypothetical protein PHR35_01695, partial [Kiritimatiellae bacterium]|nr:hypothetical protein [Kiritimatiellia bacterium]
MKLRCPPLPPSWWVVLLFALAVWGGQMVRRGLWEPDEARYAYVAAEMRDSGSWLVPHRHGEIYADKPPLLFWLINAGARLLPDGAIGPVATRLPSLLGAWLTLLAASRLLAGWHSVRASWLVLPLLSGTWLFWKTCGMGQIDALLLGLEMAALWLLFTWTAEDTSSRARLRPYLAGLCMGLAVIAKGPVGLLVPLGAWVCATLAAGDRRSLKRLPWCGVIGLALLPAALWLAACALTGAPSSYFDAVLYDQNIGRARGLLKHRNDVLYFLWHAPLDFLPWTILLPSAWLAMESSSDARRLRRRLAAWAGWVLFFFSCPASKRNLYILLAFPAAAMAIAAAAEALVTKKWIARFCLGLAAICGVLGLAFAAWPRWPLPAELDAGRLRLVVGLLGAVSLAWTGWAAGQLAPNRQTRLLPACAVLWVALLAAAGTWVMPLLDPVKTPVALMAAARRYLPAGRPLLIFRMHGETLAYHTGGRGLRVDTTNELYT